MSDNYFSFTADITDEQIRRLADIVVDQADRFNGAPHDPLVMYEQIDELLSLMNTQKHETLLMYVARRYEDLEGAADE